LIGEILDNLRCLEAEYPNARTGCETGGALSLGFDGDAHGFLLLETRCIPYEPIAGAGLRPTCREAIIGWLAW
jgi:hypothetical protein